MRLPEEDLIGRKDEELMERVGDPVAAPAHKRAAVEELARRWYPRLLQRACRLLPARAASEGTVTPEDLAQEAIARLIEHADRFDASRPLGPWLFTILARLAGDAWRAWKKHHPTGPRRAQERRDREIAPLEQAAWGEALAGLSRADQELFSAYHLSSESVESIAGRSGMHPQKVYKRLRKLRAGVLEDLCPAANCDTLNTGGGATSPPRQQGDVPSLARRACEEVPSLALRACVRPRSSRVEDQLEEEHALGPSREGGVALVETFAWSSRCVSAADALHRALQEKER
jgi:RNA polymerase sigma factor (sigma-70 family)